jgi:hypothetical protein
MGFFRILKANLGSIKKQREIESKRGRWFQNDLRDKKSGEYGSA